MNKKLVTILFGILLLLCFTNSKAQYFSIPSGIPHLPVYASTSAAATAAGGNLSNGMMFFSTGDGKPMVYNGNVWMNLCIESLTTTQSYFVVKNGFPIIPAKAAVGTPQKQGSIYFSTTGTDIAIMVYGSGGWEKVKNSTTNTHSPVTGTSTQGGSLQVFQVPVYASAPGGVSAGAIYVNSSSNTLNYYNGSSWGFVECTDYVMPVGAIVPFVGDTPPPGWFICNGDPYNTTTYADLYAVIGAEFGSNLPDLRGRFPMGATNATVLNNPTNDSFYENHVHGPNNLSATTNNDSHAHAHDHALAYSDYTNPTHSHTFSVTPSSISNSHAHGTTGSGGSHTHNVKQDRYEEEALDPFANTNGTGSIQVWRNTSDARAPYNISDAPSHYHTTNSISITSHTHTNADVATGSTNAAHSHGKSFAVEYSDYKGTHTHTITLSGSTAGLSNSESTPQNLSFNYIIRF